MPLEPDTRTNEVAQIIVDASIYVHRELGNGLLESAYELCLAHVLRKRGLLVEQQVPMPVIFDGVNLGSPYRLDLLVGRLVVVELKTVDRISPLHEAQLLSYLRLGNFHLGLLLNFHAALMTDGIMRRLNPAWNPSAGPTIGHAMCPASC